MFRHYPPEPFFLTPYISAGVSHILSVTLRVPHSPFRLYFKIQQAQLTQIGTLKKYDCNPTYKNYYSCPF